MRNLKFDLDVETNALLCPNPDEFYSRAYLTEDIADNYRTLPGIKSATKLANVTFGSGLLRASSCNFVAPDDTLDAIDIDVCALSALSQICQFDLEQSFLALQMSQGSNGDFSVPSFMAYYWNEMAGQIGNDLELIRWQGDTTSLNPVLALCDGYLKKLCADVDVIGLYTDAITSANVLARMTSVLQASPAAVQSKRADLRLFVSSDVFVNYQIAAASGNTLTYVTAPLAPTFLGIKIVLAEGMPVNTMVLALKTDLIYAFDAEGDAKALKAVNLSDSVAEPYIRTRANLKAGFHYTNPSQIVVYSVCFD
jgi:preprotein translocase subunit SecG